MVAEEAGVRLQRAPVSSWRSCSATGAMASRTRGRTRATAPNGRSASTTWCIRSAPTVRSAARSSARRAASRRPTARGGRAETARASSSWRRSTRVRSRYAGRNNRGPRCTRLCASSSSSRTSSGPTTSAPRGSACSGSSPTGTAPSRRRSPRARWLDGAVAMAMLCPEPAWLRVLHFTCPMKYKSHTAGKSCEHCLVGELEKRLLRCSRCKTVYFCDRACQKAAHRATSSAAPTWRRWRRRARTRPGPSCCPTWTRSWRAS